MSVHYGDGTLLDQSKLSVQYGMAHFWTSTKLSVQYGDGTLLDQY